MQLFSAPPILPPKIVSSTLVDVLGVEPLPTKIVRQYLKSNNCQTSSLQKEEFELFIRAVRSKVEYYIGLGLVQQRRVLEVSDYSNTAFELPYGPHTEVEKVEILKEEGFEEIVAPDYSLHKSTFYQISLPVHYSTSWGKSKQARITYTCGYTADNVPDEIRLAMLKILATEFRYRENQSNKQVYDLSNNSKEWLAPLKRDWLRYV